MKREKTLGDVYELVDEFMTFSKKQFDYYDRLLASMSLAIAGINDRQVVMAKDLNTVKEDVGSVVSAIAELVERDEKFEKRLKKLEKVK